MAKPNESGAATVVTPFRGATIDVCDIGHQAIAFAGSCPLCRIKLGRAAPLEDGSALYAPDLRKLLRVAFSDGSDARR